MYPTLCLLSHERALGCSLPMSPVHVRMGSSFDTHKRLRPSALNVSTRNESRRGLPQCACGLLLLVPWLLLIRIAPLLFLCDFGLLLFLGDFGLLLFLCDFGLLLFLTAMGLLFMTMVPSMWCCCSGPHRRRACTA